MATTKRSASRNRQALVATRRTVDEAVQDEIKSLKSQIALEISQRNSGFSSGLNINLGDIQEEYVTELTTIRGRSRIFERMANDPYVRGQLRGIAMTLISGVRWKVVGGTQQQQDLVGANILRQGPPKWWCSTSWYDRLYESLGMLIYGFALFGKTRSIVDGKMIYSHLKWLHPRTVDENGWITDGADNLIEVRRTFHDPSGMQFSRLPIASEDLFLMTWDRRGPNFEGNAFIRPMYKPWKFAELAEKIDIIDLQNRGIAIPIAHLSGAGGPKERDTLREILRSLRGANKDRAFIVLEKDEKMGYLTAEGQPRDTKPTLDHHHLAVAKAGGSEYSEVGSTAGGGRASASVLATGFFINIDAMRILIEDQINFGVGPLPGLAEDLQNCNYDADQLKEYARIEGSRVSPTEQFDNIPLIQDSIKAGLIPPNIKYCNETARRLGWPELSQKEYDDAIQQQMELSGKGGFGGDKGGGQGKAGPDSNASRGDKLSHAVPGPSGEQVPTPKEPKGSATKAFTDGADPDARRSLQQRPQPERFTGREPTDEETAILALAEINNELKSVEARYAAKMHRDQRREIENILAQIKSGLTVQDLLRENAKGKLFRYRNILSNDLKNLLTQVRNFGIGQVRDELKRGRRKALTAAGYNPDQPRVPAGQPGGGEFGEGGGEPPHNEYYDATHIGYQEGPKGRPGFHMYNLEKAIPGHPAGSTVSERTIIESGLFRRKK